MPAIDEMILHMHSTINTDLKLQNIEAYNSYTDV